MNVPRVKTAVLGCGGISDAYLTSITEKFKILELVGCCARTPASATRKAAQYGIKPLTMEEIEADKSIELVINLTPMTQHYATNKRLLQAGKHVYTEKTLALELAEAAELVALANEKNLYLGVAPDTFLGAALQTARYAIDSGLIGEVSSFTASITRDYKFFAGTNPAFVGPGYGIAFDVGIYYVTALLSLLGPVKTVSGLMQTRSPQGVFESVEHMGEPYTMTCENIAAGTLQFASGVTGNVLFDSNSVMTIPERPLVVIYGAQGILYLSDPNTFGGEVKVLLKGNSEPAALPQAHPFDTESRGVGAAELAWSLRKGRQPRASKEMAYHALEVLSGIQRSGETRRFCEIESTFDRAPALPRGHKPLAPGFGTEENAIA